MAKQFKKEELLLGGLGLAILRHWALDPDVARHEIDYVSKHRYEVRANSSAPIEVSERSVESGYAEWTAVYDEPGNPIITAEQSVVWKMLESHPAGAALDAACGTGRHAGRLVGLGHRVRGVDSTPEMLDRARANTPQASFEVAQIDSLPLSDASVDTAVCALALTHERDPRPAIHELARVVRPGGHVVISDVHPTIVALGIHAFYTNTSGINGVVRNHVHLPSIYLSAFRDAGLEVVDCVETLWGPDEAPLLPWANERPDLWKFALAELPVVIVWETVRRF